MAEHQYFRQRYHLPALVERVPQKRGGAKQNGNDGQNDKEHRSERKRSFAAVFQDKRGRINRIVADADRVDIPENQLQKVEQTGNGIQNPERRTELFRNGQRHGLFPRRRGFDGFAAIAANFLVGSDFATAFFAIHT